MNEKISRLTKDVARHDIIISLHEAILACDEDIRECDVCEGLRIAIRIAEGKLQTT